MLTTGLQLLRGSGIATVMLRCRMGDPDSSLC